MESTIRSSPDQLIWMAEYNSVCIEELQKRIGPNDTAFYSAQEFLDSNPSLVQTLQEKGTLDLTNRDSLQSSYWLDTENILPGIFFALKERRIPFAVNILKTRPYNTSPGKYCSLIILLAFFSPSNSIHPSLPFLPFLFSLQLLLLTVNRGSSPLLGPPPSSNYC